jgi:hypothetical protein
VGEGSQQKIAIEFSLWISLRDDRRRNDRRRAAAVPVAATPPTDQQVAATQKPVSPLTRPHLL